MSSIYQFLRGQLTAVAVQDNSAGASVAADVLSRSSALVLSGALSSERPLYLPHRAGLVVVVRNGCSGNVRIKGSPGETGVVVAAGDTAQVVSTGAAWYASGSGGSSFDLHSLTSKGAPVGADEVVLADSADSWGQKKATVTSLQTALGAAGGDASGTLSALTVGKLRGRTISADAPTDGQTLIWVGSGTQQWVPGHQSSISASGIGSVSLGSLGVYTTLSSLWSRYAVGTMTSVRMGELTKMFGFRASSIASVMYEFNVGGEFGNLWDSPGLLCELDIVVKTAGSTTAKVAKITFSVAQHNYALTIANRVDVQLSGMSPSIVSLSSSGTTLAIFLTPESTADQSWGCRLRALLVDPVV